ncbi:MAG: hypothetical protein QOK43_518 [Acidimicrobiaceae bacterium]|nr:hypothetical protein [Acidimicrobiaceae bacterium]
MTATEVDMVFDLLPLVDRMRDEAGGHALRDLLRVIAEQVDVVRRDVERLYDNWFIETAEDWVVPYLAQLVGWSPLPEAGPFVPRKDVADTIRHRRRKGTLALLDELAEEVGGWPGRAVEFYRLLAYDQHVNHLHLDRGRTADVRRGAAMALVDTPFDGQAHTVDVRLRNLPGVGLFVWRLGSYPVTHTAAAVVERVGRWAFTFDAVGFDTRLFTAPGFDGPPGPGPMARALFETRSAADDGSRHVSPELYGAERSFQVWAPGWSAAGPDGAIPVDKLIPADLGDWDTYRPRPGTVAVDPVRGRLLFPRRDVPDVVYVSYHRGFSAPMGGGQYQRRLRPMDEGVWTRPVHDSATLADALDQWAADRPSRACIELTQSGVYAVAVRVDVATGQSLTIRAANRVRPVLWLADRQPERPDVWSARLAPGAELVLDGLVVAGHPVHVEGVRLVEGEGEAGPVEGDGAVEGGPIHGEVAVGEVDGEADRADSAGCVGPARLVITHCTLVPGWLPVVACDADAPAPPSLELVEMDDGRVDIRHSIIGSVQVVAGRHDGEPVRVAVADSILDATRAEWEALGGAGPGAAYAVLRISRTTVFGRVHAHAIELGENSIFTGLVKVARRGIGCVRFCALVPGSRTPRRFHCVEDQRPRFTSTDFADAGYAQLSCACPEAVSEGADDQSEMGAFHDLFQPQRLRGLATRADEYTPAGMRVSVIPVT